MANNNNEIISRVVDIERITREIELILIDKLKNSENHIMVIKEDYTPIQMPIIEMDTVYPMYLNGIRLDEDGEIYLLMLDNDEEYCDRDNILDYEDIEEVSLSRIAMPIACTLYKLGAEIEFFD